MANVTLQDVLKEKNEFERLHNRLKLCRVEIKRAKEAMSFWSNELRMVSEAILEQHQLDLNLEAIKQ